MNTYSFILCALLLMAPNAGAAAESSNNNFTMIDPGNNAFAGANDVHFSWDGTKKTSVAVSGQISNAKLSTKCPFFGVPWKAHDIAVYSAGTYTVYSDCPAGSPGCGKGIPIKFTVKDGEIGIHVLLDWNDTVDIDVVNVMKPKAVASPLWTEGCGSRSAYTVWNWMSYDFDGDGVNGRPVVDGPWVGMNVNFNLGSGTADLCYDAAKRCNDNNACTTDTCDAKKGVCVHAAVVCNDNNACTADSCDPAAGCVYTPIVCNDNNACTSDSCNPIKGCIYTPIVCNDNNACTADSCNPATGCVHTPVVCNDNNACTRDSCDPAKGCIYTPVTCPADQKCDPATGNCV